MNTELINELKAQCIVREMRGTNAFDSYMVDRFDTEKFAELIVRECSRFCNHPVAVLQHFGIDSKSE